MARDNRFFQTLFDFSFSSFITTRIIGLVYAIALFFIGCIMLVIIANSFRNGFLTGIGFLIIAPLIALIYIMLVRIGLESLIAGIKTAENTTQIVKYLNERKNIIE